MTTIQNKETQLEALLENNEFIAKAAAAADADELKGIFASYGIDLSAEEVTELFDMLANVNDAELELDDLENVAGGATCKGCGKKVWPYWFHKLFCYKYRAWKVGEDMKKWFK